ncbi:HDIG domain-containing protein [Chloroflexi bacterium TSY]|nr:HDIG domain-containing protein [Chloroflexi bacterium TSY]
MNTKLKQYSETWLDWAIKIIFLLSVSIMMIFLLSWPFPRTSQFQLEPGQVAPSNIVAPSTIVYESTLETQRARMRAAQAVELQYDIPEGRIRRQQVDRSREILEFISIVRNDVYATSELQTDYLSAIPDLNLRQEIILGILNASDEQWADVVTEVPLALGRVLREEIRDNESAVALSRRRVPTLTDSNLSEATGGIVVDLVRNLIRPNSFLNEERTEELRTEAYDNIPAQLVRFEQGEIILRAGDIVTEESVEALEQIGILQGEWNWWVVGRAFFFTIVLVTAVIGALSRLSPLVLESNQIMALLTLASIVWLLLAKFMIIAHDWLPYLYPLATLGMLIAVLVNIRVGLIYTIAFTFIVLYLGTPNTFLATILGLGSLFGALILGRAERLAAFLWAGFTIALSNLFILAAFRAPFQELTTSQLSQMILVISLNGGLSASIALIGYFFLGNVFGITTSLQLTELSRPTHPLLRQLVLKSPGTYNHTIIVSNLAERAAAAIGADALLTRVGAYYHDIGKSVRPYFFIENKADGAENSHDKLDPLTSAQIIISHVADGLDLAQKYRLPTRLQDFIREHHGRTYVKYFYDQAVKAAQEEGEIVDESQFRYPGPSPQSKETAILALADTCESAIRAIKPATRTDMANLISKLIDDRVSSGDLNQCNLTFKELQIVKDIFVQVLQGVHHPRIVYPDKAKPLTQNEAAETNQIALQEPKQPTNPIEQPVFDPTAPGTEAGEPSSDIAAPNPLPGGVEQPA